MAQKIPNAEYACISGVGHLMNFEQEAPFHEAILTWIHRHF
jgi:pimeloyl-ACP methyl ester carboxylesterase